MTRHTDANPTAPPTIEALMVRFLANRSDAVPAAVEHEGADVEPYEVAAGFRVDPRAAWLDATVHTLGGDAPGAPATAQPPEWANLVSQPAAALALPMAPGHFPQRVKDLHPLLAKFAPNEMRPSAAPAALPAFGALRKWVASNAGTPVAAGVGRMLGDIPADGDAASLWLKGECAKAQAAWDAQPDSPAAHFNRGMARLFFGTFAEARQHLTKAVALIPETSGWNALARLYLAVCEIHG
jgi:hypothetical protein